MGAQWPTIGERRRLTREESQARTRDLLLESASRLFAEYGIEATPVEAIAEHAGFSRGAFYSNFANKDALIVELIETYAEAHVTASREIAENGRWDRRVVDVLRERCEYRRVDDPQWEALLGAEFWLYAARHPTIRPALQRSTDSRIRVTERIVNARLTEVAVELPAEPRYIAAVVVAIDEGISMLSLINPQTYPPDAFSLVIECLQRLVCAAGTPRPSRPAVALDETTSWSPHSDARGVCHQGE